MRNNRAIRKIFLRNQRERPVCLHEAARFAVDTTFTGFEDPRSAASELLKSGKWTACGRTACEANIKVSLLDDKYSVRGSCADEAVCAVEIRNETDTDTRHLKEYRLIKRASENQLEFLCPHVECEFNYGYTIDGHVGTAKSCMRGVAIAPDTLQ